MVAAGALLLWCWGCTWSRSRSTGNWIPSFTRGGAAKKKMIFIQLLPCLVLGMQIFVTTTSSSSREPPPAVEQYSNHIGGQHLLPGWLPRLPAQLSSAQLDSARLGSLDLLPITQSKRHLAWQFCVAFVGKLK